MGIFKGSFLNLQYLSFLSTLTSEIFLCKLLYESSFSERYKVERIDCVSTESASGISSAEKKTKNEREYVSSGPVIDDETKGE